MSNFIPVFLVKPCRFNSTKKNCWTLFVACQIFSVVHSSSTDSTCRQKNCWNLFVACQIFSAFHSSSTDSTCRQKNCWNLFVACQIFSAFHSSSTDSTCGQKTVGPCLLHVKYFQLSTVAVQIQPAGKKLLEPVCCMSNIFSFPQ